MRIISHPNYPDIIGVRSVKPISRFTVHVTFTDNSERDVDLEPYLHGPVFDPIRSDPHMFASVYVDPIGQTLAWPNGADIAPETLYYDGSPPWAEEAGTKKRSKPTGQRRSPRRRTRVRA
ncbi:MAG TPA: DUF2442 domain-containing protein [Anaerolineae bacterium]|nr:DUF2442 domain-containing protein [Anaerolineae bacterium]